MGTYTGKIQQGKTQAVTDAAQQQSNKAAASTFVDNRQEAIAQRKLQEAVNASPHMQQMNAYQAMADNYATAKTAQRKENIEKTHQGELEPVQKKPNNTGLPNNLKAGIENLSGFSMDGVKVHYNSARPAQLQAHAYAQGTDIHIAPGQEKHLPHEAWHVVQQKQGRVRPTLQMKGVAVNDDSGLEREADVMGRKAWQAPTASKIPHTLKNTSLQGVAQGLFYEYNAEGKTDSEKYIWHLWRVDRTKWAEKTDIDGKQEEYQKYGVWIKKPSNGQKEDIHDLFGTAYGTATFKRKGFSDKDRMAAWKTQADAEMRELGGSFEPDQLKAMGTTVKGIHLRHIIPYSDIAGVFRVATSESTKSAVDKTYMDAIKAKVSHLIKLIGGNDISQKWEGLISTPNLLGNPKTREVVRDIYLEIAHSQENLFQGSGSPNMALANRPDTSQYAGVHSGQHVNDLISWWNGTMEMLALNPKRSSEKVYNRTTKSYEAHELYSHDLSRPIKSISEHGDEL